MDRTETPPSLSALDPRIYTPALGMPAIGESLDEEEAKRRKKEKRILEESTKPLDPWQRYKALSDTLDAEQDLVDLADHKARFALIILGALNAGVFLGAARSNLMNGRATALGWMVPVLLGGYAIAALYFFLQAIETLRPRAGFRRHAMPTEPVPDVSMDVRFYDNILARDVESYQRAWSSLRIDNLNAELVRQVHIVAGINRAKYAALRRLYTGLKVLTLFAAVLLVVVGAALRLR